MKKTILIFALGLSILACKKSVENAGTEIYSGAKHKSTLNALTGNELLQTANADLVIGVAFDNGALSNTSCEGRVATEYNSVTAENAMKMQVLQPAEGTFYFDDFILRNMAYDNGKKRIHGHTLVWHRGLPDWVINTETSSPQPARFDSIMKRHIYTVVKGFNKPTTKFKDSNGDYLLRSWDVVNEVFYDSGDYRKTKQLDAGGNDIGSIWHRNIGRSYVEKAFRYARQAAEENKDYKIKLFYNDYGHEYSKKKTDSIYKMVMALKAIKINNKSIIDGVGLQFHMNYATKTSDTPENGTGNIEYAVRKMASTGLLVHIAELDISIKDKGDGLTLDERKGAQYYRYYFVPQMYRIAVPDIQRWGITLWNVGDNDSWLGTIGAATVFEGADYTKKYTYERFYEGVKNEITIP